MKFSLTIIRNKIKNESLIFKCIDVYHQSHKQKMIKNHHLNIFANYMLLGFSFDIICLKTVSIYIRTCKKCFTFYPPFKNMLIIWIIIFRKNYFLCYSTYQLKDINTCTFTISPPPSHQHLFLLNNQVYLKTKKKRYLPNRIQIRWNKSSWAKRTYKMKDMSLRKGHGLLKRIKNCWNYARIKMLAFKKLQLIWREETPKCAIAVTEDSHIKLGCLGHLNKRKGFFSWLMI